jgi:hypothetical protein
MMMISMTIDSLPVYVIDDYLYGDLVEEFGKSVEVDDLIDWLEEMVAEWLER